MRPLRSRPVPAMHQHDGMHRRDVIELLGLSALVAACRPRVSTRDPHGAADPIRAVAFDLFTLFDPRGIDERVTQVLGAVPGLASAWKTRLFEYSWIRAAADQYRPFDALAGDALDVAARAHERAVTAAQRAELLRAFTELEPWPDSRATLERLRARGLRLAPLANFAPSMIDRLLEHAGLGSLFDDRISTDRARTYKPAPRAYALAEAAFGIPRAQIAFAAFGRWDAAGARWFGFHTYWINRLAAPDENIAAPHAIAADLGIVAAT